MSIDEFLDSNKTIEKIGKNYILKVKKNENIDFIYKPEYGEFEYENELCFLGLFEKITKKLYGSEYDFQSEYKKELYSNYFAGTISSIKQNLIDGVNLYLKAYIEENKLQLLNNSKKIFDRYIADETNSRIIKEAAIHDYIYKENIIEEGFSEQNYLYKENTKDLIIQYIQNPLETVKKVFNEYIDNQEKQKAIYINNAHEYVTVREYIGFVLQKEQYKNMLVQELIDNPNNEYKKKRDIMRAISDLEAQMLTITLKHKEETMVFKYPKSSLKGFSFYIFNIPNLEIRDNIKKLDKDIDSQTFIKEIVKIEYKKRTIYEDKDLLKLENDVSKNREESHDIVDDMFE